MSINPYEPPNTESQARQRRARPFLYPALDIVLMILGLPIALFGIIAGVAFLISWFNSMISGRPWIY